MITITLKRDKETLNQIRFSTAKNSPITGSLYVPKEQAGDTAELKVPVPIGS